MFDLVISQIAKQFGLSGDTAKKLVATVLGYLTSAQAGGLGGILDKIKGAGMDSFLSGNGEKPLAGDQVEKILGNDMVGKLLSSFGLDKTKLLSILGSLLPLVLTKLAPGGVAPAKLPAEVNSLIGSLGTQASTAGKQLVDQTKSGMGWLAWALPLAGLAFLGFLFLNNSAKGPDKKPVDSAKGGVKVPAARPETLNLGSEVTTLFTNAGTLIAGIKDAAGAEAALPKLQELLPKADALKEAISKVPAEGASSIKTMVDDQVAKLKEIIAKLGLPAGPFADKVKAVIETLVQKLSTLAG